MKVFQGLLLVPLATLLVGASCEQRGTRRVTVNEASIWSELGLSSAEVASFCAAEANKPENKPTTPTELERFAKHPSQEIDTKLWKGFLRYIAPRTGLLSQRGMCFVNVVAASAQSARNASSFRAELGLPDCETMFEYPDAQFCLVAPKDPSGIALWQARFKRGDQKLVALGLAAEGLGGAGDERMLWPNIVRPKDRPKVSLDGKLFTSMTARIEVDEFGVTYDSASPSFDDLELPAIRKRFAGEVENCDTGISRCTFSVDGADSQASILRSRLKRQTDHTGRTVPPTPDERQRHDTVAIDAASDTPWQEMRWVVMTAMDSTSQVLLIADAPPRGGLPQFSALELGEPQQPTVGSKVREVPSPIEREDNAPSVHLAANQIVVSAEGTEKIFVKSADEATYNWDAVHAELVASYPKQLTKPTLRIQVDDEVIWAHVFRLVEAATYRRAEAATPGTCASAPLRIADSVPCRTQRLFDIEFFVAETGIDLSRLRRD